MPINTTNNGNITATFASPQEIIINKDDDTIAVYGTDGSTQRQLKTDAAGELQVDVISSALPTGAATAANQAVIIAGVDDNGTKLDSILTELSLKTDPSDTQPVSIAGAVAVSGPLTDAQLRASAVPVSASSLPLPTGASTEATLSSLNAKVTAVDTGAVVVSSSALPSGGSTSALQTTGNVSLASIDSKLTNPLPVSGSVSVSGSVAVTGPLTDAQLRASAVPVSNASLPLPSGASTSALQTTGNTSLSSIDGKLATLGTKTSAGSVPAVLASDQDYGITSTGAITANGQSVIISTLGRAGLVGLITGTFVGAMQLEGSVNGTTWEAIYGRFPSLLGAYTTWTSTATMQIPSGYLQVRLRSSAWTSGTANITFYASPTSSVQQVMNLRQGDLLAGVEGLQASGAASTANPVRVAARYNANLPAFADGNVTDLQSDFEGRLITTLGPSVVTNYHMAAAVISTNAEVLQSLTGYKNNAAVGATTTPDVVTASKAYRITSIVITYVGVAAAGSIRVRLRANTGGLVALGSPLVQMWQLGAPAAVAGVVNTLTVNLPEGLEFAAGTGVGFSIQGYNATQVAAATGYGQIAVTGYEY